MSNPIDTHITTSPMRYQRITHSHTSTFLYKVLFIYSIYTTHSRSSHTHCNTSALTLLSYSSHMYSNKRTPRMPSYHIYVHVSSNSHHQPRRYRYLTTFTKHTERLPSFHCYRPLVAITTSPCPHLTHHTIHTAYP